MTCYKRQSQMVWTGKSVSIKLAYGKFCWGLVFVGPRIQASERVEKDRWGYSDCVLCPGKAFLPFPPRCLPYPCPKPSCTVPARLSTAQLWIPFSALPGLIFPPFYMPDSCSWWLLCLNISFLPFFFLVSSFTLLSPLLPSSLPLA